MARQITGLYNGTVSAGPPPWSDGFRRTNRELMEREGMEHSLSSGWRQKPINMWEEQPKKPKMREVRLFNGRVVQVPDDDYEDYIAHQRSPTSDPNGEIGTYIYNALDSGNYNIDDFDGVGHIVYVEYSPTFQLLRVEFATNEFGTGGAVVVFFRVPVQVYSELKHLADGNFTRAGDGRHLLGIRFWDIIRIRGQRTGSRYRFEYVVDNQSLGGVASREAAADRAEHAESGKVADTDEQLYDRFAANFLTGVQRNEYNRLKTVESKESFLRKAGII